jgi:hypothetical protein
VTTFDAALPDIQTWLRDNGIDPANVVHHTRPQIRPNGSIVLDVYLLNEIGRKYVDPDDPNRVAVGTHTIDAPTIPPDNVLAWLEGRTRPW